MCRQCRPRTGAQHFPSMVLQSSGEPFPFLACFFPPFAPCWHSQSPCCRTTSLRTTSPLASQPVNPFLCIWSSLFLATTSYGGSQNSSGFTLARGSREVGGGISHPRALDVQSCIPDPSSQQERAGSGPFGCQLISGGHAKPFGWPSACQPSLTWQMQPWGTCLPDCRGF